MKKMILCAQSWVVPCAKIHPTRRAIFRRIQGQNVVSNNRWNYGHPYGYFRSSASTASLSEECNNEPTAAATTRYSIDRPPLDNDILRTTVSKHVLTLDKYLESRPIATHTLDAFEQVLKRIPPNATLVLDSGCGTGRSSRHLATHVIPNNNIHNSNNNKEQEEEWWVLGLDRSLVRLERNRGFREQDDDGNNNQKNNPQQPAPAGGSTLNSEEEGLVWTTELSTTPSSTSKNNNITPAKNILWVRAELTNFWRLLLERQQEHHWTIASHYLLYPNPYPKPKRFKSRWYAHPSFPLLLQVGGDPIVVRSNWETYLQEFAQAIVIADQVLTQTGTSFNYAKPYVRAAKVGPVPRIPDGTKGWSNFEIKMDAVGEPTFELVLFRSHNDDA